MVRVPLDTSGVTGDGSESTAKPARSSQQYGRRLAVDVVTNDTETDTAVADGGLSPAAQRWMDATPGADVDDARRYDREYQIHQDLSRSGPLPPRGEPGATTNYERSAAVNEARKALREYSELVDQNDSTDE